MPIRYIQTGHHKSSSGYSGSSHTHTTPSSSSDQYDDNSNHISECSGDSGSYHALSKPYEKAYKVLRKQKNEYYNTHSAENTSDEPNTTRDLSPVREKVSFYHRKSQKIASNFQASDYISKENPPYKRTTGDGAPKEVIQKPKNPLSRVLKHYKKVQRSDSMPVRQHKTNDLDDMIKRKYIVNLGQVREDVNPIDSNNNIKSSLTRTLALPVLKRSNSSKIQKPLTFQKSSDSVATSLSKKVQLTRSSTTASREFQNVKIFEKDNYFTVSKKTDSLCRSIKLHKDISSKSNTIAVTKPLKNTLKNSKSTPIPKSDPALIEYEANIFKRKYEITSKIGVGGGGTVYGGFRKEDKLQVAVKQISKSKIKRWGTTLDGRKIPQELELLTKVSGKCVNIISLYEWFERKSSFILIMEKPKNCIDLFDFINQKGPLTEPIARRIIIQVANSVNSCHRWGVCHRDVKDENILLNSDSLEIKLIDFGCGTPLKEMPYTEFAGTPEFYPPEWYTKKEYDGRQAAIWSIGVLLYTMIEGHVPFQRPKDIVRGKMKFARLSNLSLSLIDAIQWCMTLEPDARPTIDEFLRHPWVEQE